MQREKQKQTETATETKPKESLEQPKEQIVETPKEVQNESVSPNPNWWQQPITDETPTTQKAEETENTG